MGNPKRNLSTGLKVREIIRDVLPIQHELDLLLYRRCPSHDILRYHLLECGKSRFRVMESYDRLMKRIGRIVCQQSLEIAKCNGTLIEMLRILHLGITGGIRNKFVRTPIVAIGIQVIRLIIHRRNDIEGLSLRVAAIFNDPLPKVRGDSHDILHQFYRIGEYLLIHSL